MEREALMEHLKKINVSVVGTSEEFAPHYKGGIWVCMESGSLSNYRPGYENAIDDMLTKRGWLLENVDAGTAIIWPN